MIRGLLPSLAATMVLASVAGCSGSAPTLRSDLQSLHDALAAGQYDRVYDALDAEQKKTIDAQAFAAALAEDPGLASGLLGLLEEALGKPDVEFRARITLDDGTQVLFVLVDGRWIIASCVTTFYSNSTPEQALESFIDAYHAGRWDVIATLVPSSYSTADDAALLEESWTDPATKVETDRLVKVLEGHIGDEIVIEGNRAILVYPEGQVTFLREGGQWVILDLD